VAMNWCANTGSHIHLHRPLFHRQWANLLYSAYLTFLRAVPQRWWKLRHLRHHGLVDGAGPLRLGAEGVAEIAQVTAVLGLLVLTAPALLGVVVPALVVGFALCAWQGHAEHAGAAAG